MGLLAFGLFSAAGSALAQSSSATSSDATVKIAKGSSSANNGQFFVPSQITVTKGTTVTWVNDDSTMHTVTSGDASVGTGDGLFDSSVINVSKQFSHTFDAEGTFPYFCTLHPYMIGSVKVEAAGSQEASAGSSQSQGSADAGAQASSNAGSQASANTGAQTSAEAKTMYKPAYPAVKADANSSFVVQTDKHLYKPGEQVTVKGSIWASLLSQIGNAGVVTVEVKDNKGTMITTQNATISSQGEYTTSFTLPQNAELGAYTMDSKINVEAGLLGSLSADLKAKLDRPAKFVVVSPEAFAVNAEGKNFDVNIATNSTSVKDFAFSQAEKKVSFKVEGQTGTTGVAQVTLPKELLSGKLVVSVDGRAVAEDSNDVIVTSDTATEMTLELNYHHSEHTVEITGTNVVPEFPVSMVVMAAAIGSIIAAVTVAGKRGFLGKLT